jgi:hypothetical protein
MVVASDKQASLLHRGAVTIVTIVTIVLQTIVYHFLPVPRVPDSNPRTEDHSSEILPKVHPPQAKISQTSVVYKLLLAIFSFCQECLDSNPRTGDKRRAHHWPKYFKLFFY